MKQQTKTMQSKLRLGVGIRFAMAILLATLAAGIAVGCISNPATGRRRLNLISMEQEIEMGREADGRIRAITPSPSLM